MWLWACVVALLATSAAGGGDQAVAITSGVTCSHARISCAYRSGCGAALDNYMLLCSELLTRPSATCPEACQHALIALTSTEEGKTLMNCECEDDYCVETKRYIDVCRPHVLRWATNTTRVSSCRLSQLICVADAECAMALKYYNRLCRAMFEGKKCSHKCMNSIQILRKQEKAAALTVCHCDGQEEYDCPRMQNNLNRLCFHKKNHRGHGDGHKSRNEVIEEIVNSAVVSQMSYIVLALCSIVISFCMVS